MGLTEKAGENNLGEGEVATCHLGNKVVVQGGAWILRILKGQSNNYGCKIQYFITLEGNTCCRFLGVATYVYLNRSVKA